MAYGSPGDTAPLDASSDTAMALAAGIMSAEFSKEPQEYFRRMRAEAPVVKIGTMVVLARWDVINHAFRNPAVFSSNKDAVDLGNVRPLIPLQIDPPQHKNYRKLLDPLFAPRVMAELEADVAKLANELIDTFIANGSCDFNTDFAVPLPCTVFMRLLGLPSQDLALFLRFKDGIIRPGGHDASLDLDAQTRIRTEIAQEMYAYFEKILDQREIERRDDLLSKLLDAEINEDGDRVRLTRDQILDICFLLLIAGLDTVTDSLDCFYAYLAQHPEHREQIVADPAIIPSAIEELLRWESPVPGVARIAVADTELAGCPIHTGDKISVLVGAANTDETLFPDGYTVDLLRNPNPHVAFGGGVHRCLGSHLARLELRVAMREWHRRIPSYSLAPDTDLEYTPALRQIEYLPLVWS